MGELILNEVFVIVGAAIEVHREFGSGFLKTKKLKFSTL